jgi:hypothetical protein
MKNKPDPAPPGGSDLFNEIKKWTPKSRETIPLNIGTTDRLWLLRLRLRPARYLKKMKHHKYNDRNNSNLRCF